MITKTTTIAALLSVAVGCVEPVAPLEAPDAGPPLVCSHAAGTWAVTGIAAGGFQTFALVNGGVQGWGNRLGEIPNNGLYASGSGPPTVPAWVSGWARGVAAVATGYTNTCAILNGGVQCWGDNTFGNLGSDPNSVYVSRVPLPVAGVSSGAVSVVVGDSHACALVDGGVLCWGGNDTGQLGNGSTAPLSWNPVQVAGLTGGVLAIGAGDGHTCAVLDAGVQCWGSNVTGQLGNGEADAGSVLPVQVVGISNGVQAVAAGLWHTCVLVDGGVQCWGNNANGQLGNGSQLESHVPVAVAGLGEGVTAVAAGGSHTCAIQDGGAWCWGENSDGQLGNGSKADSLVPVPVQGLSSGVQAIAAGYSDSCAVRNGEVLCWGADQIGQLGDATNDDSSVPVAVCGWAP